MATAAAAAIDWSRCWALVALHPRAAVPWPRESPAVWIETLVTKPDGFAPPRLRCGHVVPAHLAMKCGTTAHVTVDCTTGLLKAAAAAFNAHRDDDAAPRRLWLRATVGRVLADSGCAVALVRSASLELTSARLAGRSGDVTPRSSAAVAVELCPRSLCDKDGRTANSVILQIDVEVGLETPPHQQEEAAAPVGGQVADGDEVDAAVPVTFVNIATLRSPEFAVTLA